MIQLAVDKCIWQILPDNVHATTAAGSRRNATAKLQLHNLGRLVASREQPRSDDGMGSPSIPF